MLTMFVASCQQLSCVSRVEIGLTSSQKVGIYFFIVCMAFPVGFICSANCI